jgi:DNA (cytosine-5)-methyltransferase 1
VLTALGEQGGPRINSMSDHSVLADSIALVSVPLQCQADPEEPQEAVLLIPPKLTKSAYQTLLKAGVVPRPWHTAGRHGSRTHRVGDKMGIPLISSAMTIEKVPYNEDLKELLTTNGLKIVHKAVVQSNKIPKPQPMDATVHPERKPTTATPSTKLTSTFTFAEMFAGIGGFGLALEAMGGKCVFSSELLERCREVYERNSNINSANIHGDIYQVTNEQFPTSVDLFVAGFPCQPFSALGLQPGLDDSRGVLFLEIVRFLKIVQPKAFLLENVPGLLQLKDAYETIVKALEQVGYNVKTEVVSARCLAATSRKRLLFVGLQSRSASSEFLFPYIPDLGLRARDVIDYELDEPILVLTDAQMEQLGSKKSNWKPSRLAWEDTVCDTLDSHYGVCVGKGNSQLVPTTTTPRRMSPRECASIMGFPTTFSLPTKQNGQGDMSFIKEQYRMIGNAVCPPLMAAVAGAVLERVLGEKGWEEYGRQISVKLALAALRPTRRAVAVEKLKKEFASFSVFPSDMKLE